MLTWIVRTYRQLRWRLVDEARFDGIYDAAYEAGLITSETRSKRVAKITPEEWRLPE